MKDTLVRPSYRSVRQAACGGREPAEPPPRPAPTVQVQPDAHAVAWTAPGVIAAPESTPLSFRQAGLVLRRHAGLGEAVRAGQVLAELDPAPWHQNLASAQARYEAARVARDVAERQWRRDRAQGSEGLIAQAQAEQTRGQWAQARAECEQASQPLALGETIAMRILDPRPVRRGEAAVRDVREVRRDGARGVGGASCPGCAPLLMGGARR